MKHLLTIFVVIFIMLVILIPAASYFIKPEPAFYPYNDTMSIAEKYMFSAEEDLGVYKPIYFDFDRQQERYSARDEFYEYLMNQDGMYAVKLAEEPIYKWKEFFSYYYDNYLLPLLGEELCSVPMLLKEHVIAYRYDFDGDGIDEILGTIRHPNFICINGTHLIILKREDVYKLSGKSTSEVSSGGYIEFTSVLGYFNGIYILPEKKHGGHLFEFYNYGRMRKFNFSNLLRLRIRDGAIYSDVVEWYSGVEELLWR